MKCLNPQEAVALKKHLHDLVKKALKWFMKGLDADPDDQSLSEVMPTLVKDFKKAIMKVHNLVKWANHEGVMECIKDPKANCIWDRRPDEQDEGAEGEPTEAMVQQEQLQQPGVNELIQSLDQPLTDDQAHMVADLYRSHACMLEWQGQVSMLLGKLSTAVDHKTFLAIINSTVKPLHQVTLPPAIVMKLTLPPPPKKVPQNK